MQGSKRSVWLKSDQHHSCSPLQNGKRRRCVKKQTNKKNKIHLNIWGDIHNYLTNHWCWLDVFSTV